MDILYRSRFGWTIAKFQIWFSCSSSSSFHQNSSLKFDTFFKGGKSNENETGKDEYQQHWWPARIFYDYFWDSLWITKTKCDHNKHFSYFQHFQPHSIVFSHFVYCLQLLFLFLSTFSCKLWSFEGIRIVSTFWITTNWS